MMLCTARITVQDSRIVILKQRGYMEFDTNAFVETGDMEAEWEDTGEELTPEEWELFDPYDTSLHWESDYDDLSSLDEDLL
jgi:hypothetical protein